VTGPVEIIRFRPEHRDAVARLQTVLWSPDPALNGRYLDWKYLDNPSADQPRIYLAIRDGAVIGMRGFCDSRWEVGAPAREVSIPLADDLAIHPDERNSGLVTQIMRGALADLAETGFDYVLSLSASVLTLLGSLSLGFRSAGGYDPIVRRAPSAVGRTRIRERLARDPRLRRWATSRLMMRSRVLFRSPLLFAADEREPFHRLDAAAPRSPALTIARQPRPAEMATLIRELGHDGRLRHVRSAEYLAWRFANPLREYRFIYAGRERLDGYLVLGAHIGGKVPSPRVSIVDLEGRDATIRRSLVGAAIEGQFPDLFAWSTTLAHSDRLLVRELGFRPADPELAARGGPCALVASTTARPSEEWAFESRSLLDPATWDLRLLYSIGD
jgi:Acetyltransferase (GNAT) family